MKKCSKCNEEKLYSEFYSNRSSKDGFRVTCKACDLVAKKEHYKVNYVRATPKKCSVCSTEISSRSKSELCRTHREEKYRQDPVFVEKQKATFKQYYETNKEFLKEQSKQWYENNKDKKRASVEKYRQQNKEKYSLYQKQYQRSDEQRLKKNQWCNEKYANDNAFFLKRKIRNRTNDALRAARTSKPCSFTASLGCSDAEFVKYIESKFQPGMTWDNRAEWHIDHIKPLASFNLADKEEFKKACHYSNLQPLWAKDNLEKSDRYEEEGDLFDKSC